MDHTPYSRLTDEELIDSVDTDGTATDKEIELSRRLEGALEELGVYIDSHLDDVVDVALTEDA